MDSHVWQRLSKVSLALATPVAFLVGLGLPGRWGAALEHSSWWQVARAFAPYGAVFIIMAGLYWTLRRQVRKAQADAALALHVLRNPGPLHALLRLGVLPSGYFAPHGKQSWDQREAIKLGEALGLLDVVRAADGRVESYSWKAKEATQKEANATALLAALGEDGF